MTDCPLCGGGSRRVWREGRRALAACAACGTVFLEAPPADPAAAYDTAYFSRWYVRFARGRAACTDGILSRVAGLLPPPGRLLDVGCGAGILLGAVRARGWEAVGQDVSPAAAALCRTRGFPVHAGPLEDAPFADGSFDVVTLFDVAAHVAGLGRVLDRCRRLLAPDGRLVVKTPDHGRFVLATARALSFTGRSRTLLHVPAQVLHFGRAALRRVLAAHGLEVVALVGAREFSDVRMFPWNLPKLCGVERSLIAVARPARGGAR